jgi:ubiquinone/menaquinone biosynthesis C-methylase UbiE
LATQSRGHGTSYPKLVQPPFMRPVLAFAFKVHMDINSAEETKTSAGLPADDAQVRINSHFRTTASDWDEVYRSCTVFGAIHQHRLTAVLSLVDHLRLAEGSRVLDIGCGAGLVATALAQRRYAVDAVDSVEAMIHLTRERVNCSGATGVVRTSLGDIQDLAFSNDTFSLVLAIGVLPWLASPHRALREMKRVTRPGGHLIFTMDNRWRLNQVVDPLHSPLFGPFRILLRILFNLSGLRLMRNALRRKAMAPVSQAGSGICAHFHSLREVRRISTSIGVEIIKLVPLGFGPFSLFNRSVFCERTGIRLHSKLQRFCDRGAPGIGRVGAQFLILAKKPIVDSARSE